MPPPRRPTRRSVAPPRRPPPARRFPARRPRRCDPGRGASRGACRGLARSGRTDRRTACGGGPAPRPWRGRSVPIPPPAAAFRTRSSVESVLTADAERRSNPPAAPIAPRPASASGPPARLSDAAADTTRLSAPATLRSIASKASARDRTPGEAASSKSIVTVSESDTAAADRRGRGDQRRRSRRSASRRAVSIAKSSKASCTASSRSNAAAGNASTSAAVRFSAAASRPTFRRAK